MSRFLNRRLSKIEDTMYGARKSIEDLTDAKLERALGILVAMASGEDVTASNAAFYASLKPLLAGSRGHYATMSDDELNKRINGLIGESIVVCAPSLRHS